MAFRGFPETGATYQIRFSIMKDRCEIFLDTSGVSLHKRGYRENANLAPLHETMAAAMVNLARYRGRDFFWDPFCGSGTICIEAAMIALNRAPGMNRSFGAQKWACVPQEVWREARTEALDKEYRGDYRILGTDIDPAALDIARDNARKAGVGKLIDFREADATKMSLPTDKGLMVCNPPYGERMLEQRSAQQLYRAFGRHVKFADGWKKYIISSEPEFEHYFGKQATKKRKLYNGQAAMQRLHVFLSACTLKTKDEGESSRHEAYFYSESCRRKIGPDAALYAGHRAHLRRTWARL